jgi:hypothetical protein
LVTMSKLVLSKKKSLRLANLSPWINSSRKNTRKTRLWSRSKLLKGFTFHASRMELWRQISNPQIPGKAFKFTRLTTVRTKLMVANALPSKVHTLIGSEPLKDGLELPEMEHSSVISKNSNTFPNCSMAGQAKCPN